MRVTIQFDLPEEETELQHALKGSTYHAALFDFDQNSLRKRTKYGDHLSEKEVELAEKIREEFYDEITTRGIEL